MVSLGFHGFIEDFYQWSISYKTAFRTDKLIALTSSKPGIDASVFAKESPGIYRSHSGIIITRLKRRRRQQSESTQ